VLDDTLGLDQFGLEDIEDSVLLFLLEICVMHWPSTVDFQSNTDNWMDPIPLLEIEFVWHGAINNDQL
jgi:hypothetical protein